MDNKIRNINDIKNNLKNYNRIILPQTLRCASVLIIFLHDKNDIKIILTKRNKNLKNHSGEISFPGGMQDNNETLLDTAFRETFEEIGINKEKIEIIGTIDDEISLSGHRVTPFVGIIDTDKVKINFNINKEEVEKLFLIPISHFYDKRFHWTEDWIRKATHKKVFFYRYENDIIWGLTGRIISKLINLL
jgi:8-oxo-dGTP pyrophosphatase MutT (NUDIX family)